MRKMVRKWLRRWLQFRVFFLSNSKSKGHGGPARQHHPELRAALLVLAIGTMVSLFSAAQVLQRIRDVYGMLDQHRSEFASAEQQFHESMQTLRETASKIRRRRIQRQQNQGEKDEDEIRPDEQLGSSSNGGNTDIFSLADPLFCRCDAQNRCPAGEPGRSGPPGENGMPGTPGPPGLPGLPGNFPAIQLDFGQNCRICPMGERGEPGRQGLPGRHGTNGMAGAHGRAGRPGPWGKHGLPGPVGQPGVHGKTGPKGQSGLAAIVGGKGEPGPSGRPGRAGRRGAHGPAGPNGKDGPSGRHGLTGPLGRRGRRGGTGKSGPPGPVGPPGPDSFYCPCPREKLRQQLLRPTGGYGPKNPFGRRRPKVGKDKGHQTPQHQTQQQRQQQQNSRPATPSTRHSHDLLLSTVNNSEQ